jgi:hypothetical protein
MFRCVPASRDRRPGPIRIARAAGRAPELAVRLRITAACCSVQVVKDQSELSAQHRCGKNSRTVKQGKCPLSEAASEIRLRFVRRRSRGHPTAIIGSRLAASEIRRRERDRKRLAQFPHPNVGGEPLLKNTSPRLAATRSLRSGARSRGGLNGVACTHECLRMSKDVARPFVAQHFRVTIRRR